MTVLKDISLEAKKLAAIFEATGAEVVEMDFLQISNLLLDLYGEDIRGRAFITNDPVYGEMMCSLLRLCKTRQKSQICKGTN